MHEGVVFEENLGTVYGSPTLTGDLTIPDEYKLIVPDAKTLINYHTLKNNGVIDGCGTLTGDGSFIKDVNGQYLLKVARSIDQPSPATVEQTRVALHTVTCKGDSIVEYAKSTDSAVPANGWQAGPDFTGLSSGTTYYFFARVTGSAIYMDATSDGRAIQTAGIDTVYSIQVDTTALDFGSATAGGEPPR